jgi:hypothetical protein
MNKPAHGIDVLCCLSTAGCPTTDRVQFKLNGTTRFRLSLRKMLCDAFDLVCVLGGADLRRSTGTWHVCN